MTNNILRVLLIAIGCSSVPFLHVAFIPYVLVVALLLKVGMWTFRSHMEKTWCFRCVWRRTRAYFGASESIWQASYI